MPTKIISRVIYDEDTGIPFLEDVRGNIHMAGNWFQAMPKPHTRYYIQTISHLKFLGTSQFHSIPNKLTGESTTEYIVPTGYSWHPAFIMASQGLLKEKGKVKVSEGMSIIGVHINDQFIMTVPFRNDLHYILYEPLYFLANTRLELKFMPHSKNTRVCILIGGELRKISD